MCLIVIALRQHARYPLIILANRDEYYQRPAQPAEFWQEHPMVYAGRDLSAKGTWLGITRQGKIGMLTNYRDPSQTNPRAPSRGNLVKNYLTSELGPRAYLNSLQATAAHYQGFNLIVGDITQLYYFSNQNREIIPLCPGMHGISNHLLNTAWPKVELAKNLLASYLAITDELDMTALFRILTDDSIPADRDLPNTGVGLQLERALSAIFIDYPRAGYGTRASTVITLDNENLLHFYERTFLNGQRDNYTTRKKIFNLSAANPSAN